MATPFEDCRILFHFQSDIIVVLYQGSGIRDQGSGIRDQGSGIRYQVSGIRYQVSEEVTGGFAAAKMLGCGVLPPLGAPRR
jgi:hypothetical protein